MYIFKNKTPGLIWHQVCKYIIDNGYHIKDGNILLKEVLDIFVIIENASTKDFILNEFADHKMINWMVNDNFKGKKPVLNWGYCYGMRFNNFNQKVNQVQEIINKLTKNPEAKSATISTIDPIQDFQGHMPCITTLDFKIRDDKLHLTAFFRSQDIGKKFYADILALGEIQKDIGSKLNINCGNVKIFISSAHIYETKFEKITNFIKNIDKKL